MFRAKIPAEWYLQPCLVDWANGNPERAQRLTDAEVDELFSLFGVGGPLTPEGVDWYVQQVERKRTLRELAEVVMNTHGVDELERTLQRLADDAQPYRSRVASTQN